MKVLVVSVLSDGAQVICKIFKFNNALEKKVEFIGNATNS